MAEQKRKKVWIYDTVSLGLIFESRNVVADLDVYLHLCPHGWPEASRRHMTTPPDILGSLPGLVRRVEDRIPFLPPLSSLVPDTCIFVSSRRNLFPAISCLFKVCVDMCPLIRTSWTCALEQIIRADSHRFHLHDRGTKAENILQLGLVDDGGEHEVTHIASCLVEVV